MNASEPHPEDLLDGLSGGALSVRARARLEAHVHACPACLFEVLVREDFALELDGVFANRVTRIARGDPRGE